MAGAALAALLGLGVPASAADTDANAEATIVRPLTLVNTEDLEFGSIFIGTTSGTVSVNAATNVRTATGGAILVGTGHRAVFVGAATTNTIVYITGSNSTTLARTGGGAAPLAASLTRSTGAGVTPICCGFAFVTAGTHTYYVGGTLNIPPNQMQGDYSGTFTLTVNYF